MLKNTLYNIADIANMSALPLHLLCENCKYICIDSNDQKDYLQLCINLKSVALAQK